MSLGVSRLCPNLSVFSFFSSKGKTQLKAALLLELESGRKAVEWLGTQAVLTGAAQTPKDIAAAVDSVSTGDVRNVNTFFWLLVHFTATRVFQALQKAGKKLSIASVGNLSNVPYAADL